MMARMGEIECHPAGTGADIEDRVAVAFGELPPQRQIGAVGAALQVVPDDYRLRSRPMRCSPPRARQEQLPQGQHRCVGRQCVQRRLRIGTVRSRLA